MRDESTASEIAFSVRRGDVIFTDYGISHTKEMHLIVVRDDLRFFHHLHPKREAGGVWHTPFTPPAGGTYWIYADFVDSEENPHTLRFVREYRGGRGDHGLTKSFEREKEVGGYRMTFTPTVAAGDLSLQYAIMDEEGRPVVLEEYLEAKGHSVLISPSGDFIHTHASEKGEAPLFTTSLPPDPFYRIFTQFQIGGQVLTVSFDWERGQGE